MRAKFLIWSFSLPRLRPFAQRFAQWYLRQQSPPALLRSLARIYGNGGGSSQRRPWLFFMNN
jgi:hypothetical protein